MELVVSFVSVVENAIGGAQFHLCWLMMRSVFVLVVGRD